MLYLSLCIKINDKATQSLDTGGLRLSLCKCLAACIIVDANAYILRTVLNPTH